MNETLALRPHLTRQQARNLVKEQFDLDPSELSPLPGERDQNFLIDSREGRRVLKVANAGVERLLLEAQHGMMVALAQASPPILCPTPLPSRGGAEIVAITGPEGQRHWVRLLSYVEGRPLATVGRRSPDLLEAVGEMVARIDTALQEFDHPGCMRDFYWDLLRAPEVIRAQLDYLSDPAAKKLVSDSLDEFDRVVAPRIPALRRQVIHNDVNDHNLILAPGPDRIPRVAAIIDFGDMVHSVRVADPAIAGAYAIMGSGDPLAALASVIRGYHRELPLDEEEVAALYSLVKTRLATSMALAAGQSLQVPDDPYLTVSSDQALEALRLLTSVNPNLAHYHLRAACGLEAVPQTTAISAWIDDHQQEFSPVLPLAHQEDQIVILDLSPGNAEIGSPDSLGDAGMWQQKIEAVMTSHGAALAIGRYDEPRLCYTGEQFLTQGEVRTVHMGQDLFAAAGTEVRAPLAGVVRAVCDNDLPQDYGPTVILDHAPAPGVGFHTLYGHLSRNTLLHLTPGQRIAAGELLGQLGDEAENGGWPPHLHFQLITDMVGHEGDFPGVAPAGSRSLWRGLSPDPGRLLGLEGGCYSPSEDEADDIRQRRSRALGPSLSLSYHDPLHIVRGWRQYLYDQDGRPFLDCVNNVCHVGHCHPRVVAAACSQMSVLNTNTRYLHREVVRYAERLCRLLPPELEVCYLVNSGSEANELALRLARCYTGSRDVMVLEHGYHGNTGTLVDLSHYKHAGPGGRGAPDWVHSVPLPDPYRGDLSGPNAASNYTHDLQSRLREITRQRGRLGAFMAESASGCGGQVFMVPGYLEEAYRLAREAGAVCIADEVQTGFGRPGSHFWMFETEGVVPDIVTMGKPIGNGHPLGAVVTTREIAEAFDNGMEYFNTYGGNPVSSAVGLAVLDVLEDEGLQQRSLEVGRQLLGSLEQLGQRYHMVGHVRGRGLFLGVELVRDRDTKEPAAAEAAYLVNRLRHRGILLSTDGPGGNVIKIKPPLVFSGEDGDRLAGALAEAMAELL